MSQALEKYLDRVLIYANRNPTDAAKIRAELKDHLLKKIEDVEASGVKREDAIFQAIEQHGTPQIIGYGLRPRFPFLDVRTNGTARGFIAVGPKAVGVVAIGGIACGVLAYGGLALGLLSLGGIAFAALIALGGLSVAPFGIAYGGIAIGLMSAGGISFGAVAVGGMAFGLLCLKQDCNYAVSYFSQQNAPDFIKLIFGYASNFLGFLLLGFWTSCFVMLTTQLFLSRRERNRIKNADPTLIE